MRYRDSLGVSSPDILPRGTVMSLAGLGEFFQNTMKYDIWDHSEGALLGLACGDALGTTVEFMEPGTFLPLIDIVGGGPFEMKPGEWTDDTSMALCLGKSLAEYKGFNSQDQAVKYVKWMDEGYMSVKGHCFDIGNTTVKALRRFKETGEAEPTKSGPGEGNGSLMRLAPVPIFYRNDYKLVAEMAGRSSQITHGADNCVAACRYYGALIAAAINGGSKEDLLSPDFEPVAGLWKEWPLTEPIKEIAAGSFLRKNPPDIKGTGHVVKSLEAALWAFANSKTFKEGALLAVNLGDDADTTGAVYGQLAGAFYGAGGIPDPWKEKLAWREEISSLAKDLYNGRKMDRTQKGNRI